MRWIVEFVAYVYILSCQSFNVFFLNREMVTVKVAQHGSWKTSLLTLVLLEVNILDYISNCFLA